MANFFDENAEQRQLATECIEEGMQLLHEGRIKAAEEILTRAKDIFEELDDKRQLATCYNLLSIIYDEMGNESLDMDCLLNAVELALDEDAFDLTAKYVNNIGSKFLYVKSYDRALKYFARSKEMFDLACEKGLCRRESSQHFMLIMNLNLAFTYCITGELEKARIYYEEAKELVNHPSNEDRRFTFMSFEGLMLWRLGEKEKARACVEPIMEAAGDMDYATDFLEVTAYLLDLLQEMGDFEKWEKALNLFETRLEADGGLNARMEMQKHWLDFYKASGNTEKYRDACEKFYEMTKEKAEQDHIHAADTIELKINMRYADKHKQITDSMVYLDPLTGIGNRNRMLEDSKLYILESLSKHIPLAIGLIDIDFFKECNDNYGHIKGDECLRQVAEVINNVLGDKGNVYRYGGDEFLLLMPNATVEGILAIGEAIKQGIDDLCIPNEKSAVAQNVTVSQGYTCAYAEQNDTIDTLVNLADHVLYNVKRCGRNNYKFSYVSDIRADL